MSKKVFEPTEEQKQKVFERLCKGELPHSIRLDIINPETKKPLHIDTFMNKFEDECIAARGIRGTAVCKNLFDGATYVGHNQVTGMDERDSKCIQQWLALDGRGLFGKKFKLDCNLPLKEQLKQIKQACADGLIGSQEMTAFVQAIQVEKEVVLVEQLEERLERLENGSNSSN